jgi:hypothetical protein
MEKFMINTKALLVIGLLIMATVGVAYAEDFPVIFSPPTIKVVYDGATPIKDTISTKIANAVSVKEGKTITKENLTKEQIDTSGINPIPDLGLAAKSVMEKVQYPYVIAATVSKEEPKEGDPKLPVTEVTIIKSRFDEPTQTMWYWIEATRDGQEVAVDNPVWIYPAPKDVVVSIVKDDLKNEVSITLKEDPKAAVEEVLSDYVGRQPLGKAVTGTKG